MKWFASLLVSLGLFAMLVGIVWGLVLLNPLAWRAGIWAGILLTGFEMILLGLILGISGEFDGVPRDNVAHIPVDGGKP